MRKFKFSDLKFSSPWFGKFTSAFAATICGIAVTFGVQFCKTQHDKKELARTLEVGAMR